MGRRQLSTPKLQLQIEQHKAPQKWLSHISKLHVSSAIIIICS
jgi:hypothetical protein